MLITYTLIGVLFLHIFIFKKLIFSWNLLGVFFITTLVFSVIGVLMYSFIPNYVVRLFYSYKLRSITEYTVFKTQIIVVSGFLMVLYGYIIGINIFYKKTLCLNHFRFTEKIKNNLSLINYFFIVSIALVFLVVYLFLNKEALSIGITKGLFGRQPYELIKARGVITSNYFYVIISYNILPFLTVVAGYLAIKSNRLHNRILFLVMLSITFIITMLLFQKRPLIIFLGAVFLSFFVFKKHLRPKKKRILSAKEKKRIRRRLYMVLITLFSLLLLLYYSATTYQFNNLYEAVLKLSEVALARVFGRLSMPAFLYVDYFSMPKHEHYGFSNIGLLTKILHLDFFPDTKVLSSYYSVRKNDGTIAINSIVDFYGAFGYKGLIIGNLFMGFILSILDAFLNKLEKNNINLVFIVFTFVFAYYLSQASLARSLMGYGFFFFVISWGFLQKGFKIKLR